MIKNKMILNETCCHLVLRACLKCDGSDFVMYENNSCWWYVDDVLKGMNESGVIKDGYIYDH